MTHLLLTEYGVRLTEQGNRLLHMAWVSRFGSFQIIRQIGEHTKWIWSEMGDRPPRCRRSHILRLGCQVLHKSMTPKLPVSVDA